MSDCELIKMQNDIERSLEEEISRLRDENKNLEGKIEPLQQEIEFLQLKIKLLQTHPTLAKGIAGETLLCECLGAERTTKNADHDLIAGEKRLRIEVKYSNLNRPVRSSTTKRWAWAKIFGESGNKQYDRLLLLGDIDPRWQQEYRDPDSPWIVFDVPSSEVRSLVTKSGRSSSIQLTTNPSKAKSTAALLFKEYQVTFEMLKEQYRL